MALEEAERMASTRRMGVESSETRAELIAAANQLLEEEGCAALTARRLAEKVGLKRQIVHYYFGTTDDLLVAVIRSRADQVRARVLVALEADEPLRALWALNGNPTATAAMFELNALALRRPVIRAETKRFMEEFRRLQAQALERHLSLRGIEPTAPPVLITILMAGLSSTLAVEAVMGVSEGHPEAAALIEAWLRAFAERGDLPIGASAP
jgi:AcrR family transcriptional regulator